MNRSAIALAATAAGVALTIGVLGTIQAAGNAAAADKNATAMIDQSATTVAVTAQECETRVQEAVTAINTASTATLESLVGPELVALAPKSAVALFSDYADGAAQSEVTPLSACTTDAVTLDKDADPSENVSSIVAANQLLSTSNAQSISDATAVIRANDIAWQSVNARAMTAIYLDVTKATAALKEEIAAATKTAEQNKGKAKDAKTITRLTSTIDDVSTVADSAASPTSVAEILGTLGVLQAARTDLSKKADAVDASVRELAHDREIAAAATQAKAGKVGRSLSPKSTTSTPPTSKPSITGQQSATKATGGNGKLKKSNLCGVDYSSSNLLRCDAKRAWMKFNSAFKSKFGHNIPIDESYRSYDKQVDYRKRFGTGAAKPGTSNHGWGTAVDVPDYRFSSTGKQYKFGTTKYEWMKKNGPKYGWVAPGWAQKNGSNPEPWHFEFHG